MFSDHVPFQDAVRGLSVLKDMKAKVLIVDDDVDSVDGLSSLLLLEDIKSANACRRMSARAMISGTFYSVIVAGVLPPTEEQGLRGTC